MAAGRGRALPLLLAASLATAAHAQVTTDPGALDALGKPPPARPQRPPTRRPAPRPAPAQPTPPQATAAPPAPAAKPPTVPAIPPAILALPPPVAVPIARPPPLPDIPVVDDAPGHATDIDNGVRVTFGPERYDLNPATVAALQAFAQRLRDQPRISIVIVAYAPGTADDPSAPRRLALERALAARAVLLHAGIDSPRIYPRAVGPTASGDPDRADVVAGSVTQPPAAPPIATRSPG